jgi:hypothetical protein
MRVLRKERFDGSGDPENRDNSNVIPGNPGSQSGVARPGIQEFQRLWIPASAGMTAKNVTIRSLAGEALLRQARFFWDPEHQIEILNRHAGRAFAEVIEPRH